jgi:hypothetical protein
VRHRGAGVAELDRGEAERALGGGARFGVGGGRERPRGQPTGGARVGGGEADGLIGMLEDGRDALEPPAPRPGSPLALRA